jgi:predicted SAM-dependent methyltransferase
MLNLKSIKMSITRPLTSYSKIQRLYSALARNRSFQSQRRSLSGKSLLNVGCGDRFFPSFINLDYNWIPGVDLCWDLSRPLPFPDNSLEGIFSEHCLEHLSLSQAHHLIGEFWRTLAPGHIVRIIVPDAELFIRTYCHWMSGTKHPFPLPYLCDLADMTFSPIQIVNAIFRNYGHQYAYDYDLLSKMLKLQGFSKVCRCSYLVGEQASLLIDAESRRYESLYVEAVK